RAGRGRPAGPVLADRRRRAPGRDLLRWDAPSPRHRDEPGREPAGRLPRRAHDGAGPAVAHRGVGHGARAGPWRHHGAAHHPVPRRGRAARGPDRDPAPRHDRPGRHARRAQGAAAARDGRVRREAAVPRGRVPRARRRRRHPRDADDHRGRPARRRGAPMTTHVLTDTRVLTGRSLRHVLRSPDTIITTAVTPVALMRLFVYVLGGAIDPGTGGSYVDYLLPGILLITVASGVAYTSYRLFLALQGGIVERFRSMPVARSSVLWAHVLTSLVANLVSVTLVVGVGLLLGFRTDASVGAWLAALGILVLFTLALTWLAVVAGLSARTVDGASAFSYPLIFLPFVSSAFVPTDTMPTAVAWFAENQPVTAVVDTLRALLAGQPVGSDIWLALAWLVGILVVAQAWAVATYRRRVR